MVMSRALMRNQIAKARSSKKNKTLKKKIAKKKSKIKIPLKIKRIRK
jgi:hypothetical protein